MIREIHGVADALKGTGRTRADEQYVLIVDGTGFIHLVMNDPTRLTPAQARVIAQDLFDAANRVESTCEDENG